MSTPAKMHPRFLPSASRRRRKRFLAVGVAGLAVLAAALGVSFAGNTGTTAVSVSGGLTSFVYPVADNASLPAAVDSLKYTGPSAINAAGNSITTATLPSWTPTASTAGSVTAAGDLALVDATVSGIAHALIVNVYVTNLAALQLNYSSYALPFNVWECASNCTTQIAWGQSAVVASPPTYLTNTDGFLSFSLPVGKYYVIAIDTGGSLYTISTSLASGGSLSPSFYFTAQAT